MRNNEKVTVFFDGECGICVRAKTIAQKLDKRKFIKFVDLWSVKGAGTFGVKDLAKEIHLVTKKGEIYKGYFAIKYLLSRLDIFKPVRFILNLQFVDRVGVYIYNVVSKNRRGFSDCDTCT